MNIVLDTNVLKNSFDYQECNCSTIIPACFILFKNLKICLDYEDYIYNEYKKNVKNKELMEKFLKKLMAESRVIYQSSDLDNKIREELNKKNFHEVNDQVFVAVALNNDKIIVTEDSDYGKGKQEKALTKEKQEVLSYMTNILKMTILNYEEGVNYIKENFV